MPIIHLVNQKSFDASTGVSILDSARAAGLVLAHSCRTGRCGSCRTQVLQGHTASLAPEVGLSAEERAAGWVLSCARTAQTDLRLDLADLGELADVRPATWPCRIDRLQLLAPDVMQVVLRLPPGARFVYLAGQYINLIARNGQRRSYSIANASGVVNGQPGRLALHIRRVPGGVLSRYWFEEARANDLLRFEGPQGTFFLRHSAGQDLVFLATGTGFAPVQAMLEEIAALPAERRPRSSTLLWGGRVAQDLYCAPGRDGLAYQPVLSRSDPGWCGARGHVQQVLLQTPRDWARTVVYACGSPSMVQGARASLHHAGLAPHRFHADAFVSSATPVAEQAA